MRKNLSAVTGMSPRSHCVQTLAGALTAENDFDRLQEDREVEEQRAVLHIEQVVLQLLGGIGLVRAVRIAELRPTRDARLDRVPLAVERNRAIEMRDKFRPLGARTDEAHL